MRPRIMILCGRSARHLFVANALCEAADTVAIVQETGTDWNVRKTLKKLRPTNLVRKSWRWLRDRRRYRGNPEATFFFPESTPHFTHPHLIRYVPHINHPDVVRLAKESEPDLICVFGTSLICGELLSQGRIGIINLHGGLSPAYRGADCTFWALFNGELDQVGCTLHFIDAGIDTGRLIAHICPEVLPGDSELVLFWRAVAESAKVYQQAIKRLATGHQVGVPQPGRGRLYQVKDRQLHHERKLEARLPELLKEARLPLRVKWFGPNSEETADQ